LRARLLVLTAAVLFSTAGAAVKACAMSPWQITAFRAAIAAVCLYAWLPTARGRWNRGTVLTGLAGAATMMLFVAATKRTTAASAIFLQATAPVWVFALGPRLIGEARRRRDVPIMVVIGLGMLGVLVGADAPGATAPSPVTGNVLAATAGLTWGLAILGLRSTARDSHAGDAALVASNVFAAAAALPFALPITHASVADWQVIAFLGVVQVAFAYACFVRGMRGVSALEASLLMLVEPVLNPLWAWWIQGERVGVATLAGGAIVLAAIATRSVLDARSVTTSIGR
jgi:drug/metabolite transporter (DMT)-like permease